MSLMSLPDEILEPILQLVGVEEFYVDIGKLTVCKRWYKISSLMILERVVVTERSRPLPFHAVALLRHRVRMIEFKFASCDPRNLAASQLYKMPSFGEWLKQSLTLHNTDVCNLFYVFINWQDCFLESCYKLESVQFRGPELIHSGAPCILFGFLRDPTLACRLSTRGLPLRLAELHLDLCGLTITSDGCQRNKNDGNYMCDAIAGQLPFLRRLWLRKYFLCPNDLRLMQPHQNLPMENMIVNLVVPGGVGGLLGRPGVSHYCSNGRPILFVEEETRIREMVLATSQVASRAPKARLIRVIYLSHLSPRGSLIFPKMFAHDVLTGLSSRLPLDARWDDDPAKYAEDDIMAQDTAGLRRSLRELRLKKAREKNIPEADITDLLKPSTVDDGTEPMDLGWP